MTTKSEHWDNFARYRLREAYGHALSSTDKSTQNGAIILSKDYGKTIAWGTKVNTITDIARHGLDSVA